MKSTVSLSFYTDNLKQSLSDRFKRAEGQIRAVNRMIQDDKPCPEVLHQLNAVGSALYSITELVLRNYLDNCVADAIRSGDSRRKDDTIDELMEVLKRFGR